MGRPRENTLRSARLGRCSCRPIDEQGTRFGIGKGFDDGDIGKRLRRIEIVPIAGREGLSVTKRERPGLRSRVRPRAAAVKSIAPGVDDGGDRRLQRLALQVRRVALIAADDIMRAHQRPFRIVRIDCRDAAFEDTREIIADSAGARRVS